MSSKATEYPRLVEQARRYARADRTDPFSMARMLTHIKVGVANGTSSYNAEEFLDERRFVGAGGREIVGHVTTHRSMVRP